MTQSIESVRKWLSFLKANYPSATLTEDNVRAYLQWLRDIPEGEMENVLRTAMKESPDFIPPAPKIGAIYDQKARDRDRLDGDREWDKILAHVQNYGAVCYPSDPLLALDARSEYALRIVGGSDWRQAIAGADAERLHWLHENFVTAYNRHADTAGLMAPSRDEARKMLDSVLEFKKLDEPK